MASETEHIRQWQHNHNFLKELIEKNQPSDWIATIAFYTAMHSIERFLARYGTHPDNHGDRNLALQRTFRNQMRPIYLDYIDMKELSEDARYDCHMPTPDDINRQIERLAKIDQYIKSILPPLR